MPDQFSKEFTRKLSKSDLGKKYCKENTERISNRNADEISKIAQTVIQPIDFKWIETIKRVSKAIDEILHKEIAAESPKNATKSYGSTSKEKT